MNTATKKSINRNFNKRMGFTGNCPSHGKNAIEKSCSRNSANVVKRMKPAIKALMQELGIGSTAINRYSKFNIITDGTVCPFGASERN